MTTASRSDVSTSNAMLESGNARFTVITDTLIRLEYSQNRCFTNQPSLFAVNRTGCSPTFSSKEEGGCIILETSKLKLTWDVHGDCFSEETLSIELKDSGKVWKPGLAQTDNLRGPLQTLDNVMGYVPMPEGLLSRDGWYLLDDSKTSLFDDRGWIRQRKPLPQKDNLKYEVCYATDWYFFGYGSDYKRALRDLTHVGGSAAIPRRMTLGSWFCRWFPFTSSDFRKIVAEYEKHEFPLDIMVLDMDWHRMDAVEGIGQQNGDQDFTLGWTGYSWNRDLLPDTEALLQDLKDKGLGIVLNDHPHDGIRSHEDCYAEFMEAMGKTPEDTPLPFNAGDSCYMDAFFRSAHDKLEADGVDFWWLDWQQDDRMPFVPGVGKQKHLPWLNDLYFRQSAKDGKRGQSFSRWGGWGDHRHPIHFSGDIHANWEALAFEVEFTLRSSNSGCFFWSHDIGGFCGERDPELYARWTQFGAMSAALRLHSCGDDMDRRPWLWGEPFTASMKCSFDIRNTLMPYIYTGAFQCYRDSLPLLRPMYLDYPDQDEAYSWMGQYLLGDHILVAPICERGEGSQYTVRKRIWLPEGDWYDWFTGELITGGQVCERDYDILSFPIFVRAGAVIPTQPQSQRMASTLPQTLLLKVFPLCREGNAYSEFIEDDGISDDYKVGNYHQTGMTLKTDEGLKQKLILDPVVKGFPWRNKSPEFQVHKIDGSLCEPLEWPTQRIEVTL